MIEVLQVPAMKNNHFNKDNLNQFTLSELRTLCSTANHHLRNYCQEMGFDEYPYILTTHATPQQMRGWLLFHFPTEYHLGRMEVGSIAGHHVNRGVERTTDGRYFNVNNTEISGMHKF